MEGILTVTVKSDITPSAKPSAAPSGQPGGTPGVSTPAQGDVDGNGVVELKDAQKILKVALKIEKFE